MVARNCQSIFILSILSLIHEESLQIVEKYLHEHDLKTASETVDGSMALTKNDQLDAAGNRVLVDWITRMQMVLSLDPEGILMKLMIDEKNIDGTVLQLCTFVVQDFFEKQQKKVPFEKVQPLTASILQTIFEPFIGNIKKRILEEKAQSVENDEEDDDE